MTQYREEIKTDFKIITTIEVVTTYMDGFPDSTYVMETDRAIPLLDSIIMMSGILYIESDPEGQNMIHYVDKTVEYIDQPGKLINEFDHFFELVSYLQSFRDK